MDSSHSTPMGLLRDAGAGSSCPSFIRSERLSITKILLLYNSLFEILLIALPISINCTTSINKLPVLLLLRSLYFLLSLSL